MDPDYRVLVQDKPSAKDIWRCIKNFFQRRDNASKRGLIENNRIKFELKKGTSLAEYIKEVKTYRVESTLLERAPR